MKTKCPSCDGINQFDFDYMCGPGTFYVHDVCVRCGKVIERIKTGQVEKVGV